MNIEYTDHAIHKMKKRHIAEDEVASAIKYPENTRKVGDKYYAMKNIGRGSIEVVFIKDKYIKVITVYWIP